MSSVPPIRCDSCGTDNPARGRFCSSCGASLASEDLPTFSSPGRPGRAEGGSRSPSRPRSAATGLGHGRFAPGDVLAGRYRIVALLGRGGMGEVYRADDLTLGQPVALKFLPEAANDDPEVLERFRGEVRIARKVSHPNVCRVYDIGEAEGRRFLSMEYVDGEDLASLLRRIGRLPPDKALDVARRVCAGLAAAHNKGVLHRDLKPANVMLDAQGHVLITDFGLATLAGEIPQGDVRSGTPAYMAPEQLQNKEVTVRSDVYALGLVLYEVLTGKRAFEAASFEESLRSRTESGLALPSSLVADLDPAVERVILRCLEQDPARRPQSVLAVAAALPGGDPLAAALAAGETPAPEVVAAAGESGGLAPRAALLSMAIVIAGLAASAALAVRTSGLDALGLESPPEALAQRARETIRRLRYEAVPADTAQGFRFDEDLIRHVEAERPSRAQWRDVLAGRLPVLTYWYRTSPRDLVTPEVSDDLLTPGVVRPDEPPTTLSGMINLTLDQHGRLTWFQVIPAEKNELAVAPVAPDWSELFAAAELDPEQLRPTPPLWTSLASSDARAAWTGTWPGTSRPLRVEAAAWQGKPVFFAMIGPWTPATRLQPSDPTSREKAKDLLLLVIGVSVLVGSAVLAWRNFFRGRGDRRGAVRLACFVFCAQIALWLCRVHPVAGQAAFGLFVLALGGALFAAASIWVIYLALEPYVRRHWPQTIISWSRLLAGRLRDPLTGRDVLFGVILGLVWTLLFEASFLFLQGLGRPPALGSTEFLLGGRSTLAAWIMHLLVSVRGTVMLFFLFILLRVALRRRWPAAGAFVLVLSATKFLGSSHPGVEASFQFLIYGSAAFVVMRYGLVALATGILVADLLLNAPASESLSSWWMGSTLFLTASVLALAGWGFYTSLGGRPLWRAEIFD